MKQFIEIINEIFPVYAKGWCIGEDDIPVKCELRYKIDETGGKRLLTKEENKIVETIINN